MGGYARVETAQGRLPRRDGWRIRSVVTPRARASALARPTKPIAFRWSMAIDFCNMLIGYARGSTHAQDNAAQLAALNSAECELVFEEKASRGRWERPE